MYYNLVASLLMFSVVSHYINKYVSMLEQSMTSPSCSIQWEKHVAESHAADAIYLEAMDVDAIYLDLCI